MTYNMVPIDPDSMVEYNLEPVRLRDLPPAERAGFGMGHFPSHIAQHGTHPGDWPYTPEECLVADLPTGVRINNGQNVACPGCGLDGT